ncbi:MAG: UDP-N-acetylmuramoyl-L-alanyl-D-glutamate--2,6-diaminopimelate ligase [Clostridia bacterium]
MRLKEILQGIPITHLNADEETEIESITDNSREVGKNSLFLAIKGEREDGNNYVNDAIKRGAAVVLTQSNLSENIPFAQTSDIRLAAALAAGNFYKQAYKGMKKIAVVGTNGKTTTAYMIAEILKHSGKRVTLIGTLGAYINGNRVDCDLTTPDPIPLHKIISESQKAGVEYLVYELSAHGIHYKKTAGLFADVTVFTNFSQDHLDFFASMEEYANVKKSFFSPEKTGYAVVNADDKLGLEIIQESKVLLTSYALNSPSDTFAIDIVYGKQSTSCIVNCCDEIFELKTNFVGEFNLYNALSASAAVCALSVSAEDICKAFSKMQPPEGRFNILQSKRKVIIDFAHTPEGLKNLLIAARKLCSGKLIAVFGCGGDRDPKKRGIMGTVSAKYADFSILTSDNSRSEEPDNIISQIEQGHREINGEYIKITERESAITYALLLAKPEDLVVIAGKGGEEYMEECGIKRPYSDKKVVEEIFRRYNL